MGELHDFGRARRERAAKQGVRVAPIDKLVHVLGLQGDIPSSITAEDLERVASSPDADPEARAAAEQIGKILRGEFQGSTQEISKEEQ